MSGFAEVMAGMGALISGIGALFAGMAHSRAKESAKHAGEVNDAVNHRHEQGTPRLYDMVLDIHADVKAIDQRVSRLEERPSGQPDGGSE